MSSYYVGDPIPRFAVRSTNNPNFNFDTTAGRFLVLSFFGSGFAARPLLDAVHGPLRHYFDDVKISFFGVSVDTADEKRIQQSIPGLRYFWDFDQQVSQQFSAIDKEGSYQPFTLVLDPNQRVLARITMDERHNATLASVLRGLPSLDDHAGVPAHAPILIIPRIFEPGFCRDLISIYEREGGTPTGVMREIDGATVGVRNDSFKRRKDFAFETEPAYEDLRKQIGLRFRRRLVPEIQKAFQFSVSHIERYLVACYEAENKGFFRPHRDNTTKGTAHRRFACTLNLNAEDFDGGDLRFPEYGTRTYRAPTGGAVIFSCSMLHEATPVTRGNRYAFLPFLYDADAAAIRRENRQYVSSEVIDQNN